MAGFRALGPSPAAKNNWWKRNNVPPIPEEFQAERSALSDRIREWHPDYNVGDCVVIRPGTLGNLNGKGCVFVVAGFFWRGSHLCTQMEPPYQSYQFIASTYVKANEGIP